MESISRVCSALLFTALSCIVFAMDLFWKRLFGKNITCITNEVLISAGKMLAVDHFTKINGDESLVAHPFENEIKNTLAEIKNGN